MPVRMRADRELGLDADHGVVRAGHAGVGDRRGAAGLDAGVARLDVRVRADHRGDRPSSQRATATFSLVASAWKSTTTTAACRARLLDELVEDLERPVGGRRGRASPSG